MVAGGALTLRVFHVHTVCLLADKRQHCSGGVGAGGGGDSPPYGCRVGRPAS